MSKRVFTYSIIGTLAVALVVPAIAFSQMGPRGQGSVWEPQSFGAAGFAGAGQQAQQGFRGRQGFAPRGRNFQGRGALGFAHGRGQGNGPGAQSGRGFGREFAGRGGGFSGMGSADHGRPSLAARALTRADALNLTVDQEEQIRAAQRAHQEASIERRAAMQVAQLDMRELMSADTKDITAIESNLRALADLQIAARTSGLYLDQAVGELLTDEQFGELEEEPRHGRGRRGTGGPRRDDRREAIR